MFIFFKIAPMQIFVTMCAHVVDQCTNRCTRRKVIVNAQPPTRKPKMKKISQENRKILLEVYPRAARLHPEQKGGREKGRVGRMATDKT